MSDLSDKEKEEITQVAMEYLPDIAAKYELDNAIGLAALIEAFQAGIKFAVKQMKEVQDED